MRALRAGDPAQLRSIAAQTPSFPRGSDGFVGRPWLINAVDGGSVASVRWMLDEGLDPDLSDDEGTTPLTSAMQRDDEASLEMVDAILDAGADVNAPDAFGRTPLHEAAVYASAQIVTLLLDRGADPGLYDTDYSPVRPWEVADNANRPEIAELIRSRHGAGS